MIWCPMDKTITDLKSKKSFEWWTPRKYPDGARAVMGDIELDPASCEAANKIIKAQRFYTLADDGLAQPWHARSVWLNPPYCRLQAKWVARLIYEYEAGNVQEAIILVPGAIDTGWCQELLERFPCCMVKGRINFISPDGKNSGSTFGSLIAYLGPNIDTFVSVFSRYGVVMGNLAPRSIRQITLF